MKNLILFARKRGGKTMADKFAAEIMDALTIRVVLLSARRICIVWLGLTVRSLTLDSNLIYNIVKRKWQIAIYI